MKFTLIFVAFLVSGTTRASEEKDDPLVVSKKVMEFIMGCKGKSLNDADEQLVPVFRTDISPEGSSTSQQVSLIDVKQLETVLNDAMKSSEITDRIINQIKKEHNLSPGPTSSFRQDCPATNTINIDVPPEELEVFHTRMERVMQQNNNILLGLINDMISTKFTNVQLSLTQLVNGRMDALESKIGQLLDRFPAAAAAAASAAAVSVKDDGKSDTPESNQDQEDGVSEPASSSSSDAPDTVDTTTEGPAETPAKKENNQVISKLSQLLKSPKFFVR